MLKCFRAHEIKKGVSPNCFPDVALQGRLTINNGKCWRRWKEFSQARSRSVLLSSWMDSVVKIICEHVFVCVCFTWWWVRVLNICIMLVKGGCPAQSTLNVNTSSDPWHVYTLRSNLLEAKRHQGRSSSWRSKTASDDSWAETFTFYVSSFNQTAPVTSRGCWRFRTSAPKTFSSSISTM